MPATKKIMSGLYQHLKTGLYISATFGENGKVSYWSTYEDIDCCIEGPLVGITQKWYLLEKLDRIENIK